MPQDIRDVQLSFAVSHEPSRHIHPNGTIPEGVAHSLNSSGHHHPIRRGENKRMCETTKIVVCTYCTGWCTNIIVQTVLFFLLSLLNVSMMLMMMLLYGSVQVAVPSPGNDNLSENPQKNSIR